MVCWFVGAFSDVFQCEMALKCWILLCFPSRKNIRAKDFLDFQQNDKKIKPVAFFAISNISFEWSEPCVSRQCF